MNCEIMSKDELYFENLFQKEMRACERLGARIVVNEFK